MAQELEKIEFKNTLVDSFKSVKNTGTRVIDLIKTMKNTVTTDKATIQNSTLLTDEEKIELKGEYTSRLAGVKTAIESELGI